MTMGTLTVEDRAMRATCAIERKLCAFACDLAKNGNPCAKCSAGFFQGKERDEVAVIIVRELRAYGVSEDGK